MAQLLVSFLVVLHLMFRGSNHVTTEFTGREKLHRHCCLTTQGKERCIVLRCRQYRHTVRYQRWYMRNRTHYTYTVELVFVDGDVYLDYHSGSYPQLCLRILNITDYPLHCAIGAHLDFILK